VKCAECACLVGRALRASRRDKIKSPALCVCVYPVSFPYFVMPLHRQLIHLLILFSVHWLSIKEGEQRWAAMSRNSKAIIKLARRALHLLPSWCVKPSADKSDRYFKLSINRNGALMPWKEEGMTNELFCHENGSLFCCRRAVLTLLFGVWSPHHSLFNCTTSLQK